ncbi:MAG: hypothetical protein LBV00_06410 [Propionibacteriaceae bacterium]|jgi:hypothetical protein|nr:hypothetical protein [Propionibacteriaceae bacterium]
MHNTIWAAARLNLKNLKLSYLVTGIVLACTLIQDVVLIILHQSTRMNSDQQSLGWGMYFYLLPLLAAVTVPLRNLRRMVNLGAKRSTVYWGGLVTYVIATAAASLLALISFYLYEPFVVRASGAVGRLSLIDTFGWASHGPITAFFQQFAFLLLLTVAIHTVVLMQDKWYGWVTDGVIVAIIAVFTPIAPLRGALVWFFSLIITSPSALQIGSCLVLTAVIYGLSRLVLDAKPM